MTTNTPEDEALDALARKIFPDRLSLAEHLRAQAGKSIVLTNGCFDLLHPGHVTYLARARALGDCLVVALNSDRSVRAIKGPDRPLNAVEDRALVLAARSSVDYITFFDEDTPVKTIEVIKPDVHCKGGDYRPEDLPEASTVQALGGRIVILPFISGYSTTDLVRRIHGT